MSTNTNHEQEEIDLGQLFGKIGNFFSSITTSIFKGILFVQKNIILLIALVVIGAGLGYYIDNENRCYDNNIIVTPNLGGADYLYSKIDLLSSKLKEGDKKFFKAIGVNTSDKIIFIEVEPVIDIYSFVNSNTAIANNAQNTQNFELMKLLAESSDINKVIKDKITSKNYPHHNIHIITSSKTSRNEIIDPILKYLNTDEYFGQILATSRENVNIKINKNLEIIAQTDSLIGTLTRNLSNQKGSNLVYNNENNQFNSLFELKNNLINEIASQKINLINLKSFIKDISIVTNVINNKGTNGKMKLVFPILFIFGFIFLKLFMSFYKKQKAKLSNK